MSLAVWKFPFDIADEVSLEIPEGAQIIHFARDPADSLQVRLAVWAIVDPERQTESRTFGVRGTGHVVPTGVYVSTLISRGFVWHLFEKSERALLQSLVEALL